jgi:hypothetical protein
MGFAHPACIPHLKVEGLCGAFLKSDTMEQTLLNLSTFNHNHHPSRVKMVAKFIRRGIRVLLIFVIPAASILNSLGSSLLNKNQKNWRTYNELPYSKAYLYHLYGYPCLLLQHPYFLHHRNPSKYSLRQRSSFTNPSKVSGPQRSSFTNQYTRPQ